MKDNHDVCPFCSQKIPYEILNQIKNYFDEKYVNNIKSLNDDSKSYDDETSKITKFLTGISKSEITYLDLDLFNEVFEKWKLITKKNYYLITKKNENPSIEISLENTSNIIEEIIKILSNLNKQIEEKNKALKNKKKSKEDLKNNIKKYIYDNNAEKIINYKNTKIVYKKKLDDLNKLLKEENEKNEKTDKEISFLQRQMVSVAPTVEWINNILKSYSFTNFRLEEDKNNKECYKIIRDDGKLAYKTLSDGEKTFLTFLYFYSLILGTHDPNKNNTKKIIVIDDPVSSLDSGVMYIVKSIISWIINECKREKNKSGISQVFLLTHNVYFYASVVYHENNRNKRINNEKTSKRYSKFFTLSKRNKKTIIKKNWTSQLKSSYSILWEELRQEETSPLIKFNLMRRILEYYFEFIGGYDYKKILKEKFDNSEFSRFDSLFNINNDLSHYVSEETFYSIDEDSILIYMKIFKKIFIELNQKDHFEFMFNDEYNNKF